MIAAAPFILHLLFLSLLYGVSGFLRMSTTPVDAKMHGTYDDLAKKLYTSYHTRCSGSSTQQFWLCIAGGPGSGKSTMAAALAERVDALASTPGFSVVLPMDGYHYSRAQLQEIGERPGSIYTYEQLIARRGSPWTFDAPALCAALSQAKTARSSTLATYSRQLSDPVPDGVKLRTSHRVVIVEGNYLLNYDDPLWAPLRELFDERWYLSCASLDDQRRRLINRHLETWSEEKTRMWGPGEAGAAAKADANDVLNAHFIATTAKYADSVIISV